MLRANCYTQAPDHRACLLLHRTLKASRTKEWLFSQGLIRIEVDALVSGGQSRRSVHAAKIRIPLVRVHLVIVRRDFVYFDVQFFHSHSEVRVHIWHTLRNVPLHLLVVRDIVVEYVLKLCSVNFLMVLKGGCADCSCKTKRSLGYGHTDALLGQPIGHRLHHTLPVTHHCSVPPILLHHKGHLSLNTPLPSCIFLGREYQIC